MALATAVAGTDRRVSEHSWINTIWAPQRRFCGLSLFSYTTGAMAATVFSTTRLDEESVSRRLHGLRKPQHVTSYLVSLVAVDSVRDAELYAARLGEEFPIVLDLPFYTSPRFGYRVRHVLFRSSRLITECHLVPRELAALMPKILALYGPFASSSAPLDAVLTATDRAERLFDEAWNRFSLRNGMQVSSTWRAALASEPLSRGGSHQHLAL